MKVFNDLYIFQKKMFLSFNPAMYSPGLLFRTGMLSYWWYSFWSYQKSLVHSYLSKTANSNFERGSVRKGIGRGWEDKGTSGGEGEYVSPNMIHASYGSLGLTG